MGCVSLAHCRQVFDEGDLSGREMQVAFSKETIQALNVKKGSFITICEPWRCMDKTSSIVNNGTTEEVGNAKDDLIYGTNYCFVSSTTDNSDLTKELGQFEGKREGKRIWRDVISEMYADFAELSQTSRVVAIPGKNSTTPTSKISKVPSPKVSSRVLSSKQPEDEDASSSKTQAKASQRLQSEPSQRLKASQRLPFLPPSDMAEESVPFPSNVRLFSNVQSSYSATLMQRHNITVFLLYAIPPNNKHNNNNNNNSESSSPAYLYCLDPAYALKIVGVASIDSFAPSVLDSLQSCRRIVLRLEGLILLENKFLIDPSACALECLPRDFAPFPFSLCEAHINIPEFDESKMKIRDLVLFSGRILQIDFENAFSERVCPNCSEAVEDEGEARQQLLCSICKTVVSPVDRVTMHVFVEQRGRKHRRKVKMMLTSEFAQRLLPPVNEGEEHYDAEKVLRQPLERIPCLVDSIDAGSDVIVLKQIVLFSNGN